MKAIDIACANFSNYRPHKDKSISLSFETPELTSDEVSEFHKMHGLNCHLIVAPLECSPSDEVLSIDRGAGAKSPSERLYNAIFRAYKTLAERGKIDEKTKPFRDFYDMRMNWHIEKENNSVD